MVKTSRGRRKEKMNENVVKCCREFLFGWIVDEEAHLQKGLNVISIKLYLF